MFLICFKSCVSVLNSLLASICTVTISFKISVFDLQHNRNPTYGWITGEHSWVEIWAESWQLCFQTNIKSIFSSWNKDYRLHHDVTTRLIQFARTKLYLNEYSDFIQTDKLSPFSQLHISSPTVHLTSKNNYYKCPFPANYDASIWGHP